MKGKDADGTLRAILPPHLLAVEVPPADAAVPQGMMKKKERCMNQKIPPEKIAEKNLP